MKKYNAPEIEVLSIDVQNMIAVSPDPYVPGIDPNPQEMIKDIEDISSDLFGNESFGGAEEW